MDTTDKKIIDILSRNAREPYNKIAEKLGLSEGAVRYRMKSLVKEGIINRFTVDVSDGRVSALVGMNTNPQISFDVISKEMKRIGNVQNIYEISGDMDMFALVSGESVEEINKVINSIRTVKGVVSTTTYLILQRR